ncbi:unnamed protein product [Rotaria socialis]|uniref:Uncharacterized protein n=2 Tax=Rotaria socialis TaxID=392032 RepID=A0A820YX54_9BILA|nr:unnamed protein product [Rotaria socialis]
MLKYPNHHYDLISTVPLSPFVEGQWNRIVTYSPMYADWPDYVVTNPKRAHKDILRKRSLISPVHLKTVQLEDKLLLNELHSIQRIANLPTLVSYTERSSSKESKYIDGDNLQRTTSPTDEYQRSADFFHMTREPPMMHSNYAEQSQSLSHQTYSTKHSSLEPKV